MPRGIQAVGAKMGATWMKGVQSVGEAYSGIDGGFRIGYFLSGFL